MTSFLDLLTHYPGFVPSVLMGALLIFWLLAILGVLDFDSFGPHFDADLDLPEHGGGEHAEAPETLFSRADAALYAAKQQGRDRIVQA